MYTLEDIKRFAKLLSEEGLIVTAEELIAYIEDLEAKAEEITESDNYDINTHATA